MSRTIWRLLEVGETLIHSDRWMGESWGRQETIPDSPAPSWISVDLAMPDKMGMVLALRKDRTADVAYVHEGTVSQYTHWMPLPALPVDDDNKAYAEFVCSYKGQFTPKVAWDAGIAHARGGKP